MPLAYVTLTDHKSCLIVMPSVSRDRPQSATLAHFPHAAADWDLNVENDLDVETTGRKPLGRGTSQSNISRLSGDKAPRSVAETSIGDVSFW